MAKKNSKASQQSQTVQQPQEVFYQQSIGDISKEAYLDIGNYVNNHRHLADVRDGCKVSYKRLIYSALQYPKGKLIPATNLIAYVQNYHPHNPTGLDGLNALLVNSGVFSGEGSFGYTEINGTYNPPAASRYLNNCLSDTYWEILGDTIKYVPKVPSPVGALEADFLSLPLPLCLYLKGIVSGLGFGISTVYPNFSPVSLYNAYIKNDPSLLEPNVNLVLDKKKSELQKLWDTGKGIVTYSYKTTRMPSPDGKTEGILFEGDTCIFTPKLKKFDKLVSEGKVYIENMTDYTGPKLFVGRVPGARGITIDDIEKIADVVKSDSSTYVLNVTDTKTCFRIPLKEWLAYTMTNYITFIGQVNDDKIRQVQIQIKIQEAIPLVTDYILNKNPKADDTEISKALGLDLSIISSVMTKPISYLRKNKDTSNRIKELKSKLSDLKKFNAQEFTFNIIQKL